MTSRQDPILKLILTGPLRYDCPKDTVKEASTDCWGDISENSDNDQPIEELIFSKSSKKKSIFKKKTEKRKRYFEMEYPLTRNNKNFHKTELPVSPDFEESIKKSKCSETDEAFIDLFPPSGVKLRDETLKELFTAPVTDHQAMDSVSISIILAKAKLKKLGRMKSVNPRQRRTSISPSASAFTAATAFRRKMNPNEKSRLGSFDHDYITLWTRPVQDTEIEEFQITFQKPRKMVPKMKQEVEAENTKDEKPKKRLIKVVTLDYTEILSDVNTVKEDNDREKWTKVHEKVLNWAKKNVVFHDT